MSENNFIEDYKISESICNDMINYFETYRSKYSEPGQTYSISGDNAVSSSSKKSTDMTVKIADAPIFTRYIHSLSQCVSKYFHKYPMLGIQTGSKMNLEDDIINLQHYKPNEGFYEWHCERLYNYGEPYHQRYNRTLVYMTYLNDVDDGGTLFHHQKIKFTAKVGRTIIWPADWTFTHKGEISKTKEKYIATGWLVSSNPFDKKMKIPSMSEQGENDE